MENFNMNELPRNDDGTLASWAWPGGYPIYYLDSQNSVLCPECANKSDGDVDELTGFKPVAFGVNWEDASLYCDNCSERIESAYAEDAESDDDSDDVFLTVCTRCDRRLGDDDHYCPDCDREKIAETEATEND